MGRRFDALVYRDPEPSRALIRLLGPINRHLILRRVIKLRAVELPAPDRDRLTAAVNPGTAAFLGPGHPEFMTDWIIDKEISWRISPLMAHWASWEVVNMNPWAQAFWLRNNLIANAPGGGGREYSVRWALSGHGVLLHPEGTATWHGDTIGPLVPGIVEMAWTTWCAARDRGLARPVHVVPIVWKLHFTADAAIPLAREMALIERELDLPAGRHLNVEDRFANLQCAILERRTRRFGFEAGHVNPATFFETQAAFASELAGRFARRYGETQGGVNRMLQVLRRGIRRRRSEDPDGAREDHAMMLELERLHGFVPVAYGGPTLTQEQIAENLKQLRAALLTRGWRNTLHNLVPVAVAPRIARIRVPERFTVDEAWRDEAARERVLTEMRARMQGALDALNVGIEPETGRWRRPNPFALRHRSAGGG